MTGWPVREQWKNQGKMDRQCQRQLLTEEKTMKLRSKRLGMTVRFLLSSSLL